VKLYFNDKTASKELRKQMEEIAVLCASEEKLDPDKVSVSVSFVDKNEIKRLNKEYRNVDSVTDVLSFPQFDIKELKKIDLPEIELGDVVICLDKLKEQAKEFGHSEDRECLYLFTHSIFHLLGYDHMTESDKKKMRSKEEKIMKKINLPQTSDKDLMKMAKEAAEKAFAPFSDFHVGAAILTKDGHVFTGCNVENSSYGATICAERVAAVKAVSEGYKDFEAIAVTAMPCGICRQFLYEFSPDMRVIVGSKSYKLKDLLPEGFRLKRKTKGK
jgi:homotetrameric cytidine deaminase/rRNA maturation RNase YbeY